MRIAGKVLKWTLIATGSLVFLPVLVLALALLYFFVESFFAGTRQVVEPTSATFTIVDFDSDTGHARGYWIDDLDILLTNHHVAAKRCPALDCTWTVSVSEYNPKTPAVRDGLEIVRCVKWLDVCALAPAKKQPLRIRSPRWTAPAVGTELVTLLEKSEGTGLIVGKVSRVRKAYAAATLDTKKGYSGSPLFDRAGEFKGLLFGGEVRELNFDGFVHWMRVAFRTFSSSAFVPADTIDDAVLCPFTGRTDCVRKTIDVFLDERAHYSAGYQSFLAEFETDACSSLARLKGNDARNLALICRNLPHRQVGHTEPALFDLLRDGYWYRLFLILGKVDNRHYDEFLSGMYKYAPDDESKVFLDKLAENER